MKVWVIVDKKGKPAIDEWDYVLTYKTKDTAQRELNGIVNEGHSIKRMELK